MSVFFYRPLQLEFFHKRGIVVQAYRNLGTEGFVNKHGNGNPENEVVRKIAKETGKTNTQILLRWCLQKGVCIIPKSKHPERIDENADIFSFNLSKEQMNELDAICNDSIERDWMRNVFEASQVKDVV